MPQQHDSPAVRSLQKEQKRQQQSDLKNELDRALDDTFPASDPASATHTTVPGGPSPSSPAQGETSHPVDRFEDNYPPGDHRQGSQDGDPTGKDRASMDTFHRRPRPDHTFGSSLRSGAGTLPDGQTGAGNFNRRVGERPISTLITAFAIGLALGIRHKG